MSIKKKTIPIKAALVKKPIQAALVEKPLPDEPVPDTLPWQAYALVANKEQPATWQLPHHTRQVHRAVKGKIGYEHTLDWELISQAVQLVSLRGIEGRRVNAEPEQIIDAARHLAIHYQKAGKPLPLSLAVLV
jgi:hypothetical protein